MEGWYRDLATDAGEPRIDTGIGGHQRRVADIEMPRDVGENLAFLDGIAPYLPDDVLVRRERIFRRCGRQCRPCGEECDRGRAPAAPQTFSRADALRGSRECPDHDSPLTTPPRGAAARRADRGDRRAAPTLLHQRALVHLAG